MTLLNLIGNPYEPGKEALVTQPRALSAGAKEEAVAVIGAGPAGLMAAEQLAEAGYQVDVFDAMPSVARKFLRAGVGGLNLTHNEDLQAFTERYTHPELVRPWLGVFGPDHLRQWVNALGIETFVGSSRRVFPVQMKASPLLRAWLQRLREQGVRIHTRHRWTDLALVAEGYQLSFDVTEPGTAGSERINTTRRVNTRLVVLALGGGSWARLGSNGQWSRILSRTGIKTTPFTPSNCGFDYPWSEWMRERFAGQPLKPVALSLGSEMPAGKPADTDASVWRTGEAIITRHGVQGGLIYQASRALQQRIELNGFVQIYWDLMPDRSHADISRILAQPRGKQTFANFLRKRLAFSGARAALLNELAPQTARDPDSLASAIKCLPQRLHSARPLDEAISTGGGIPANELSNELMLRRLPGVFCAGEMLDWDAPTGGYLLNACLASGQVAGAGAVAYLNHSAAPS
jgi:uncharacterized flavoprotein (TIGR03862 family)